MCLCWCQIWLQVIQSLVFVIAGPNEVEGHTRNLLINSHNDKALFRADGEQTLIGPDKLRITGALMCVTCSSFTCSSLPLAWCVWLS